MAITDLHFSSRSQHSKKRVDFNVAMVRSKQVTSKQTGEGAGGGVLQATLSGFWDWTEQGLRGGVVGGSSGSQMAPVALVGRQ